MKSNIIILKCYMYNIQHLNYIYIYIILSIMKPNLATIKTMDWFFRENIDRKP